MKIYILLGILFLGASNVWASSTCRGSSQGVVCPDKGPCTGFVSTSKGYYQCGYSGGYGSKGICMRISRCDSKSSH
ncbi:MAG: hypothetical protein QG556_1128 [Pseudomonadota bacterium]|nr:hypothetical protein [Pseudomonadota bacterium]